MEENQNMDMVVTAKPKRRIFIILLLIFILLSIIGFSTYIVISNRYITSVRFAELLGKDQAAIELLMDTINVRKNAEIENKFTIDIYGEEASKIEYSVIGTKDGFDMKGRYIVEDESGEINIIKEENEVAIYIPQLYEKYFAINNENLTEVLLNLDFEKNTDEKKLIEIIKDRYVKLLAKEINAHIEVKTNMPIIVEDKEYKTIKYELILDSNSLSKVYENILTAVEEDEEVKQLLLQLCEKELKDYYGVDEILDEDREELRKSVDQYILQLKSKADYIKDSNIEINIAVHDKDGKNIKTNAIIKLNDEEIKFELLAYTQNKKDTIKSSLEIENQPLVVLFENEKQEKTNKINVSVNFEDEEMLKISGEGNIIKNSEREIRKLEDIDLFLINTASKEELQQFVQKIMGIEPLKIEE